MSFSLHRCYIGDSLIMEHIEEVLCLRDDNPQMIGYFIGELLCHYYRTYEKECVMFSLPSLYMTSIVASIVNVEESSMLLIFEEIKKIDQLTRRNYLPHIERIHRVLSSWYKSDIQSNLEMINSLIDVLIKHSPYYIAHKYKDVIYEKLDDFLIDLDFNIEPSNSDAYFSNSDVDEEYYYTYSD